MRVDFNLYSVSSHLLYTFNYFLNTNKLLPCILQIFYSEILLQCSLLICSATLTNLIVFSRVVLSCTWEYTAFTKNDADSLSLFWCVDKTIHNRRRVYKTKIQFSVNCFTAVFLWQGLGKLLVIVFILTSFNPFRYFGQDAPPTWWIWCIENKLYACLMIFFLCNALEGHLVSTGAFEISLNGKLSYISAKMHLSLS